MDTGLSPKPKPSNQDGRVPQDQATNATFGHILTTDLKDKFLFISSKSFADESGVASLRRLSVIVTKHGCLGVIAIDPESKIGALSKDEMRDILRTIL